ncbi:16854_t:CDS:2, partial [Gigaspora margarita]
LTISLENHSNNEQQQDDEYTISNKAILDKKECNEDISINKDGFNDIQFTKPVIRSNIDFTEISEFVSLDSTFFPGTSATAHIEVNRLFSLLEEKKAKIDCILDSQNVYAVGVNFQKDYSMPCIICWVSKYLDINIKEQLSNLFNDEFEVMEEIVVPIDTDVNNSNSAQNRLFNNNGTPPSGNEKESEDKENDNYCNENGEKNGDGTNGKDNNGKDDENGDGTNGKENDGKDDENGYGDNGGENNENNNNDNGKENHDKNTSRAVTKENSEIFQEFDIVAAICANVTPVNEYQKILEFSVDVIECGMGAMLSENSSLHKLGSGYFLDSIVIEVSPVPQQNRTILWKVDTQPEQPNRVIKVSTNRERSKGIKGQVNGAGIQVEGNYDEKNALNTEKIVNEWEMKLDGCFTTGVRWSYFHKDSIYTSNFAPELNVSHYEQNDLIYFLENEDFNKEDTQKQKDIFLK